MDSLLNTAAEFIARHSVWAGAVLGLVTLLESLVLIGAFVPATALMVMAGGLIATGVLDPVSVIIWCVTGAVIGDAISYEIGRRLGPRALRHRFFRPHRRKVARSRLYTRRYGSAAIFAGRFFGPLRAFAPVLAGMFQMRPRTFQVVNVVSALVWAPVILAPGYFATKGLAKLEAAGEADALTIGVIIAVAAGVVLLVVGGMVRQHWRQRKAALALRAAPERS